MYKLWECLCLCAVVGYFGFQLGRIWDLVVQSIIDAWRRRRRATTQTTWVYCPCCRQELTGGDARCWDGEDELVYYSCGDCGTQSRWDFDFPVPVLCGIQEA
jgi:hypothetical protein